MNMTENEQRLNEAINQVARGQVQILDRMEAMIKVAVKETVNGKLDPESPTYALKGIDARMAVIQTHMDETKEIMEAFRGVKAIGEMAKWISGVGVALAAMYALIKGSFKI